MDKTKSLGQFRILVILPSLSIFGLERATVEIMRALKNQEAKILFVLADKYSDDMIKLVNSIDIEWVSIKFVSPYKRPGSLRELMGMIGHSLTICKGLVKLHRNFNPDCIFMTNLSNLLYAWPYLLLVRQRALYCVHDCPDLGSPSTFKNMLQKFLWTLTGNILSRRVVANSAFTRNQLIKAGIKGEKISCIYPMLPTRDHSARCNFEIQKERYNIVYIGRLSVEKGLNEIFSTALKLIREYSEVNFILIGDYSWNNPLAQSLITKVKSEHLENRIMFLGQQDDIDSVLSVSDLHIAPSMIEESFGLTVLEAKKHGIPSIVFPSGGYLETVSHMRNGYICGDKTADSLYTAIKYYIENPEIRTNHGNAAQDSLKEFSTEKRATEWVELLKREYHVW